MRRLAPRPFLSAPQAAPTLPKVATGITGFDDLTYGGLPAGRPTLICGAAGCGKTLFASTFLINGARLYDEPGVFVTFEGDTEYVRRCFSEYGMVTDPSGRLTALYRPFHLIGLELNVSILSAALRGELSSTASKVIGLRVGSSQLVAANVHNNGRAELVQLEQPVVSLIGVTELPMRRSGATEQ